MESLKVYKIGGNVIDNPETLDTFLREFASLTGPAILVHGGGKEATRLCERMGIGTTMIRGRRVTDMETLDVVTMVYAGLINKRIVAGLQSHGRDALGLSGADAHVITAVKRNPKPVDYGFVGDLLPNSVNISQIKTFLDSGLTPVFCAIMCDDKGQLLNCNADSVSSAVAVGMSRIMDTELVYCFEKNGVLSDVDNPESVIPEITETSFESLLAEGVVADGMIPKITNALNAVRAGVKSVTIRSSADIGASSGTIIRL